MTTYTFGVIGCQHSHIASFIKEMQALGHHCAGIYEADNRQLAQAVAERCNVSVASDLEPLLRPEVGMIGCASINKEKIDVIELCERYGKPIMLDKPIVTNRQAYDRLEQVIRRGKIQVGMRLSERFNSPIYTMKKLLDRRVLGEIVSISMRKPHRLSPGKRPNWFFSREQSGGICIDLLIHDFDLLRWLTGKEIVQSNGYMVKKILPEHPTFYDVCSLHVMMVGGILGNLYADWHTAPGSWTWGDGRIFIAGTKGTAELRLEGDPSCSPQPLILLVEEELPQRQLVLERAPWTMAEDFLRRLSGQSFLIDHKDILAASLASIQADEKVILQDAFSSGKSDE